MALQDIMWPPFVRRALLHLYVLGVILVCRGDVLPGFYHVLHRSSGRYLLSNVTLGFGLDGVPPLWDVKPSLGQSGSFIFSVPASEHVLSSCGSAADDIKGSVSLREGGSASAAAKGTCSSTWYALRACGGSCLTLVDDQGRNLVGDGDGLSTAAPSVHPTGSSGSSGLDLWVLLKPCAHEQSQLGHAWQDECFPPGSVWASGAASCCDTKIHGPRGDSGCFDEAFTFERCCPEEAREAQLVQDGRSGSGIAQSMAPRILCSGERLEGEERSVKLADSKGTFEWHKTTKLLSATQLDFAIEDASAAPALWIVEGLPACGGIGLLERAKELLPATELHMVDIFNSLHQTMVQLSKSSRTMMPDLPHNLFYLPFFPFLLITLHRITGDSAHLQCLSQSTAVLGENAHWQKNAGYDFVLALGYDRPWERRPVPGMPEESYQLQLYDPRFINVLVLATHDAFFGDRHVHFQTNQGGNAYRNLRHIIVPLPFELNCSKWRQAVTERRQRPPPFAVSFVGSVNGVSRSIIRLAAERITQSSGLSAHDTGLAVHFVLDDSERALLGREPAQALRQWFGEEVSSFEQLLRASAHCLVLPGDVSDLAMRFFHALSVGCTPVVVGSGTQTIPLPFASFIDYRRFARFATVRNVEDALGLLKTLMSEHASRRGERTEEDNPLQAAPDAFAGLFMRHTSCSMDSGEPFRTLVAKELVARAQVFRHVRWYN
eukprot:TRINITY_DN40999_c0_g1_i1.p1 TRINITY_DN40999_c0_g1~~TRINITY_DN40999_c0_g1_i1.p1  ORF type:complete len:736 (+),score=78.07 TRINITY_DN40999_c0_g1_i1:57-2210(+)